MDPKEEIIKEGLKLGLDLVGFSQARILEEVRERLETRAKEGRQTTLECSDPELRVNPERVLPNAKTVITAGIAYYSSEPLPNSQETAQTENLALRGRISRSAWGIDYHRVLGEKLERLAEYIRRVLGGSSVVHVDTGPPVDRALAVEAGLGWSGKNCAFITREFGSWVFLGQIYTDLALAADPPVHRTCGECNLCLEACPTGALREAYIIDPFRCLSYLTQMKGFVPRPYRKLMGTRIYGCDTCQQVCPANRQARSGKSPEFRARWEVAYPSLPELLRLSNREFKEIFAQSAAAWRGRTVLQRNALIALGNLRQREAIQPLLQCLEDQRPVIRGHAAWALAEIGEPSVLPVLQTVLKNEQDDQVREEMNLAIEKLTGVCEERSSGSARR
ncbi:MAG TPA: tRNA epoxyqueuosine(34) reductase QueG [Desulfobacteria bacterium]|nr:tRNA epoxyqueuosine(34) reductase QueG [Desulfobacteria bacterium]